MLGAMTGRYEQLQPQPPNSHIMVWGLALAGWKETSPCSRVCIQECCLYGNSGIDANLGDSKKFLINEVI